MHGPDFDGLYPMGAETEKKFLPRLSHQMIEVRSSYFGPDNPYTTAGVQVAGFGRPGLLVEMDAIAVLDGK